jgi:hypothetical protein
MASVFLATPLPSALDWAMCGIAAAVQLCDALRLGRALSWGRSHRAEAIFCQKVLTNPAATEFVNQSADPPLTEPSNALIYKEINR